MCTHVFVCEEEVGHASSLVTKVIRSYGNGMHMSELASYPGPIFFVGSDLKMGLIHTVCTCA